MVVRKIKSKKKNKSVNFINLRQASTLFTRLNGDCLIRFGRGQYYVMDPNLDWETLLYNLSKLRQYLADNDLVIKLYPNSKLQASINDFEGQLRVNNENCYHGSIKKCYRMLNTLTALRAIMTQED